MRDDTSAPPPLPGAPSEPSVAAPTGPRVPAERDLRQALGMIREARRARPRQLPVGDEVACQSCGGHTTFTGARAANCPFCLTPIRRDDGHPAGDRLPVDGVVPFAVDRQQARELIRKWINKRWFAPSAFKEYGRTGSFTSVYGAYFTFDADTLTHYRGERGDDYEVGADDNRRTETRWCHVSGAVHNSFDDITVFANVGMDAERLAKLEPWPAETAKPYSAEYVTGHLCRTPDRDVEECCDDATSVMTTQIRTTIEKDIGGDRQRISSMDIEWKTMTYRHLLMPIWLLTVIHLQHPYQVYINGVTGEVQGARPYSKAKIIAAIATAIAVIVLIAVLVVVLKGGGST
jgi:hypothetical protein